MKASYRPTAAEINLDDLRANYEAFRGVLPQETKFMGCVKGNAYGHGAVEVTRELERLGADYVSVAFLDEALGCVRREYYFLSWCWAILHRKALP